MNNMKVIWSTMTLQMKNSFIRPMYRFCIIASPIINTILLFEMFKHSGQDNFATYIILGAGLMGLWTCICFSSVGDINRERYMGTLSLIFAAPTEFRIILLGKVLGNTVLSLTTLVISYGTAKILYRAPIVIESPGYFLTALVATILCFITLSVCIAYLLTLSRKTQLYMNCLEIPLTFLCGFVFPVEILPNWLLPISYVLSPTWAIKLMRFSVAGVTDAKEYYIALGISVLLTTIYIIVARLLYKIIEQQVRIKATLEVS